MSNPISSLHETDETPTDLADTTEPTESTESTDSNRPELEVDETFGEADSIPPLEIDPPQEDGLEASEGEQPADPAPVPTESKSRTGLIALVLAVLLVGSVAINLKQSRDVGALEAQSAEFEQALTAAVERIDVETARANGAEAALERVDTAVDLVNEKVLGLQEALDGLREATLR